MDQDLNLVSVRVYNEGLDEIQIKSTDEKSQFCEYVKGKIEKSQDCWNELKISASDAHRKKVESHENQPNPKLISISIEEQPMNSIIFEMGLCVIEVGLVGAVIYAMIVLPMFLKSVPI